MKNIFLVVVVALTVLLSGCAQNAKPQNMTVPAQNKIKYQYHHIGIPTDKPKKGEKYSDAFKFYLNDGHNEFRIQWMRFTKESVIHPLIQSVAHVAFKVENIDEAIKGKKVILEPCFPLKGFKVAFIEVDGAPIELIETSLSEEEIWNDSLHEDSVVFPKNK